jgi:hypothetical protein
VAKYKKKRARELKHDKFRDWTLKFFERVGDQLEGKGRTILYGVGALVIGAIIIAFIFKWVNRRTDDARQALGRAITIASAPISTTAPATSSTGPSFSTAQERAQKAIEEFQKVADKHGNPYRTEARYFIATNLLLVDRGKGMTELAELSKNSNTEVAILAKFALAQAKEADAKFDEAATLYREVVSQNSTVVTPETANLRLALVYKQQGKKKEAADLLFNIVDTARKAKDPEGNPATQSQAARDAAQELQKVDPDRYAQLPAEAPPNLPF